jgi:hypothetical protein
MFLSHTEKKYPQMYCRDKKNSILISQKYPISPLRPPNTRVNNAYVNHSNANFSKKLLFTLDQGKGTTFNVSVAENICSSNDPQESDESENYESEEDILALHQTILLQATCLNSLNKLLLR